MAILTLQNLDPNYLPFYDYRILNQAKKIYRDGLVKITQFDGQGATCEVSDEDSTYTVQVVAASKQAVRATCDCPYAQSRRTCKHIAAAAFALSDHVRYRAGDQWQYRLMTALDNAPKPKPTSSSRTRYAILFGLTIDEYANGYRSYRLTPYRIKSSAWPGVEELARLPDSAAQNDYLVHDRSWMHHADSLSIGVDPQAVVNLTPEGVSMFNLMLRSGGYYYGMADLGGYLPLLAKTNAPVFRYSAAHLFQKRIQVLPDPVRIEASLTQQDGHIALQAGFQLDGIWITTGDLGLYVLSNDQSWVLAGGYIFQVENRAALTMLEGLSIKIPQEDQSEFLDKYLQPLLERIPLHGDAIVWEDVQAEPIPRIYLRDDEGRLIVSLKYTYGDYEVPVDRRAGQITTRQKAPGSWTMVRIQRDPGKEEKHYQTVVEARFGLKRAMGEEPAGTFELRARTHPLDFLLHAIPKLTEAGFEIYGEESLKSGRLNRNRPTISLNISSGVDWFDIQATVSYGDQQVSLHDIRQALRRRERFVKLADGSIGQIPDEWLDRYKQLFDLAEETDDGLRVRDFHLPLVDSLLEEADESQVVAEFHERRERLQSFRKIRPQPVPAGFIGELRPYQQAGLEWLHFLHDYGFGGCLADDMGLGKTIQVLAFLQSLREQGKLRGVSLLVVPKSLLANWQREAERFTPDLRILEYMGNFRKKDTAVFEQYNVVMTTYGTMLRDIEFLSKYRFFYTILDESQNIKNPLALSSKATRLLKADHRLVLTGTPVENNTFELWSQFAFLNPGLLGGIDYFKREFAAPIESQSTPAPASGASIQLLRKLVYPFILRRTKEQVAPELPPRNERTLYTDLEPAQRKLYNQTRDYYRGMLLGMIDDEGITNVRMKILEGLLRLRQICIHPALVSDTYRGESAKYCLLLETLETLHDEGHKVLIFSQFVSALHLLQKELNARGYPYTYLDGQTQDRQAEVDAFQSDPKIPFFLISLKAGGLGLNLTAADYVVQLDPWWNPAVEKQAADRAHRIGQDKPVFIYKLIARGSVEEKILQLQEHKKELVDQIISPESSFFKSITKDDVKALFS
jgi:non-specific serine/threonine protein kinase